MKILQWIEDEAGTLVVAAIASVFGAVGAFLLMVFVGARFIRGETGSWFGIMPGLPVSLGVGVLVFALVFRKLRSR